jgi:hypothetical protein
LIRVEFAASPRVSWAFPYPLPRDDCLTSELLSWTALMLPDQLATFPLLLVEDTAPEGAGVVSTFGVVAQATIPRAKAASVAANRTFLICFLEDLMVAPLCDNPWHLDCQTAED